MKKILKTKFLKKKVKGFSLVEVLCAVVLLALVATPILQALCQGMVVNNKSRKMLAAADLASDTMEFVSTLAFNDYKYTNSGGTEITVPGLKSYYWGNDIDATHTSVEFSSFKLRSAQLLYPNGPHAKLDTLGSLGPSQVGYSTLDGWTNWTCNRFVMFREVKMDGYDFTVKISTFAPKTKLVPGTSGGFTQSTFLYGDLAAEKYYCYDVNIEIIEPGTNKVLATASTKVPNKF